MVICVTLGPFRQTAMNASPRKLIARKPVAKKMLPTTWASEQGKPETEYGERNHPSSGNNGNQDTKYIRIRIRMKNPVEGTQYIKNCGQTTKPNAKKPTPA